MAAYTTTTTDLGAALGAIDRQVAGMRVRAARSARIVIRSGAEALIAEPWRLRRLFGDRPLDAAALLLEAERRLDEMRRNRGHWSFDVNRVIALRQTILALRWMRRHRVAEAA